VHEHVERLLAERPQRVLEIGCGTGLLLFQIAPHTQRYCGVDFSQSALDYLDDQLRQRPLPQVQLLRRAAVEKIHSTLCIADLAFDVNLLVSLKRAGFKVLEVPIEWTDMVGSKVTTSLFRQSTAMFFSVVRVRLIYSPFYKWLRPLRPVEAWIYKTLRAPKPLSRPKTGDGR